ncbi:MAG: hypothetical protein C0402_09170 [Thermodesulfovibrio sp.]|nr:hypothetical protein [Thermodesulfovibrio sp.]
MDLLRREIRQLRKQGRELEGFYDSILNGIPCGVWVSDSADRIYYANKGMEMIAGTTKQKLVGHQVFEDVHENLSDAFVRHYEEARNTLQPLYYSAIPVLTPAGRQTYQSGWLLPKIRSRRYDGMICIVEDITSHKAIAKALSESEAKYQDLVQNVNSVILRLDLEGRVTFFNLFAQNFFGFPEREILGKSIVGTIVPDTEEERASLRGMLRNIGRDAATYANRELINVRRNGEPVWIAWTNKAIFDSEGQLSEILCVGNDVTARKQNETLLEQYRNELEQQVAMRTTELTRANEALQLEIAERKWAENVLRKSEEKYRLVVENANEGVVVGQDGLFKYTNQKALRITGFSEAELTSMPFIELFHPDDRDIVMERYLRRLRGDSMPSVYSCRIIDKAGDTRWLEINSVLITWMGRPAILTFFSNITERKTTEEQLRLLESAMQQTSDSIIITTARKEHFASKIVYVNDAFTRMTGYTPEDVIGRLSVMLQGPKTDSTEWFRLEGDQVDGKTFHVETLMQRKDRSKFYLEWRISPIRNEQGKVTHFVSMQRDISKRKKDEEELLAYQEQLRSFTSELSLTEERERRRIATDLHDHIGQILAITKIRLGALRDVFASTHSGREIDEIRALVEQAIGYTKSLTFELSPPILYELGLPAAVEWLCEKLQKEHGLAFICRDDGKEKPLAVDVTVLLFQALRELLINVVKHARATQVTVDLKRSDDTVRIIVSDNGIGFDPALVSKGSTFGLFSVRERLKHFGGHYEILTKPGSGTTIIMRALLQNADAAGQRWP